MIKLKGICKFVLNITNMLVIESKKTLIMDDKMHMFKCKLCKNI